MHRSFPADGYRASWRRWDGDGADHLELQWDNEAWTARGRVELEHVEYVIRLSPLWQIRQFLLFRDLDQPDLWLGTDGHGHWGEINGTHRAELDGSVDVTLACTPFTLTPPIRRLELDVGMTATLSAVTVDVETLSVVAASRTFHRISNARWRVESVSDVDEFDVDDYGLPLDVDGRFHRIT